MAWHDVHLPRTIILWSVANGSLLSRIERQEEENLHCLLPISKGRLVTGSNSSFLCTRDRVAAPRVLSQLTHNLSLSLATRACEQMCTIPTRPNINCWPITASRCDA